MTPSPRHRFVACVQRAGREDRPRRGRASITLRQERRARAAHRGPNAQSRGIPVFRRGAPGLRVHERQPVRSPNRHVLHPKADFLIAASGVRRVGTQDGALAPHDGRNLNRRNNYRFRPRRTANGVPCRPPISRHLPRHVYGTAPSHSNLGDPTGRHELQPSRGQTRLPRFTPSARRRLERQRAPEALRRRQSMVETSTHGIGKARTHRTTGCVLGQQAPRRGDAAP